MLSFYNWMQEKYVLKNGRYKNNRFGDLANDIANDPCFPRDSHDSEDLKNYFSLIPNNDAYITAKDALKKYIKSVI